jgi:hypothetical protein
MEIENPTLKEVVQKENPMKEWLVNYVGESLQPKDGNVTVMMIVEQMLKEFPEFLMAIAEENFIRGYDQAIQDVKTYSKSPEKQANEQ